MTLPTKKRRTIRVGQQTYYWLLTHEESTPNASELVGTWIVRLLIEPSDDPGVRIQARFSGKHSIPAPWEWEIVQNVAITPQVVREVIEQALAQGWTPQTARGVLTIVPNEAIRAKATLPLPERIRRFE